jgi:hypothetical protein
MAYSELTTNLISPQNRLESRIVSSGSIVETKSPTGYVHDWEFTNAQETVVAETYIHPLQYSFEILPIDENEPVEIQLNHFSVDSTTVQDSLIQFHARFKCSRILTIETTLIDEHGDEVIHSNSTFAGNWSTGWSGQLRVSENDPAEFSVHIRILGHSGSKIHMTLPTLVDDVSFYNNPFVQNGRRNLPTFMWDKDKEQTYPQYPFYKLMHALTYYAGIASQMSSNFYRFSKSEISAKFGTDPVWANSILVDADYVHQDYEKWLAQFIGAKIIRSITVDGVELIDDPDAFATWQLNTAYFGREAGTTKAIRETVKQILTGNKVVYIIPGGTSFVINIYTLTSETPGVAAVGDTSDEVLAIANLTRPLGFELHHEVFDELPLLLDDPDYGILDEAVLGSSEFAPVFLLGSLSAGVLDTAVLA